MSGGTCGKQGGKSSGALCKGGGKDAVPWGCCGASGDNDDASSWGCCSKGENGSNAKASVWGCSRKGAAGCSSSYDAAAGTCSDSGGSSGGKVRDDEIDVNASSYGCSAGGSWDGAGAPSWAAWAGAGGTDAAVRDYAALWASGGPWYGKGGWPGAQDVGAKSSSSKGGPGALARTEDEALEGRRFCGQITRIFGDKHSGYGFIGCAETKARWGYDVYVHAKQMNGCQAGDKVYFSIVRNAKGEPQARQVIREADEARYQEKQMRRQVEQQDALQRKRAGLTAFNDGTVIAGGGGVMMDEEAARRFQKSLRKSAA